MHPDKNRAKNNKWKTQNRDKYLAHKAVEGAIRRGHMTKAPCERCGHAINVHAHHEDYGKPLDVVWLCPPCHRQRHAEIERDAA
jgi:hypothetical protein